MEEAALSFQPFPSVDRQLINLEEEIRLCQLPFEEKNVRRKGRREEGREDEEGGREVYIYI